jgi:NADPH-dependent 2,4-dienoyl-CoA reductase/sulfur reductase-like enzyme/nitrite reductase/ring-hydroxylating ferredoxin subunit
MEQGSSEVFRGVVAKVSELKNGEMREVAIDTVGKILLVKENNEIRAVGNKCTHYGAPLKDGVLCNGRIRCPWHGACFNTSTGDIEDSPGLDSIRTFKVELEGDNVVVHAPIGDIKAWKRTPPLASCSEADKRIFVIIGGGAAGQACAETLRMEGYTGRVVVVSRETDLPYDRPKLSKALSAKAESILLRPESFYKENNIEFLLGQEVVELDPAQKHVVLRSGETIRYNAALVATGGDPRRLNVPGKDLGNIYCLRVPSEAHAIGANAEGKNVVIVGSSFIGMEVASCVAGKAASVAVIGMERVPFERVLGVQVGAVIQRLHEQKGVRFYMQRVVKEFKANGTNVGGVVLDDGTELGADVVVIGAGIIPATGFIKNDSGLLNLAPDGSILVDQHLRACEGLYAAGDLARFPYALLGHPIRVEHWSVAQSHGRIAARNMLGHTVAYTSIPFFWTVQFGKSIRYAGHVAPTFDSVHVEGDVEGTSGTGGPKFVAYYGLNGRVLAVATLGMDPLASAAAELLANGKMPSMDELKRGSVDFKALL